MTKRPFNWRDLLPEEVEQHFNPRVAIADPQACLEKYAARSEKARAEISGQYDIRYGTRPKETLDLYIPDKTKKPPLLFFIHGGYWRALDKSDHSFIVPPFLNAGITVANVNYDLCPDITLDTVVDEVADALQFCVARADEWGIDSKRVVLAGHSAGAHLVASLLAQSYDELKIPENTIKAAALFTGIYDPEIALHVSVNEEIQLVETVAKKHNYLQKIPCINVPLLVSAGADEPRGWIDQSERYAAMCTSNGLDVDLQIVDSANHFSLLEYAATPGHSHNDSFVELIMS